MKKPIVLTVVDGLGLSENKEGNAFLNADTPVFDDLFKNYPNSVLGAAEEHVGLPKGQMGNSEVGHLNIGAGEMVYTGLALIQKALDDDTFKSNPAFQKAFDHVKKNKSTLHLMGLLSPGGVHSLEEHLWAIMAAAHANGVTDVSVHAFLDGRDVEPRSATASFKKLSDNLKKYNYKLATISGRLYAMDRDAIFERTNISFNAMLGNAKNHFDDSFTYLGEQYVKGLNDEFVEPAINNDKSVNFLEDNDAVISFNFRPDRARQIAHQIIGSKLWDEKPPVKLKNIEFVQMMNYEGIESPIAFDQQVIKNPIGKVFQDNGIKQLRIAETQKYAHVTFFMDGGVDVEYKNADRIMVPSEKVANFAEKPLMSAKGITDELISALPKYDAVIMNFANPDMVGHTGEYEPAVKAVGFIDKQIGRIKEVVDKLGGTMFITADHGNAEIMSDKNGNPVTSHSTSDVFLICTDKNVKLKDGILSDVSTTVLDYMGIEKPDTMTAKSLLVK